MPATRAIAAAVLTVAVLTAAPASAQNTNAAARRPFRGIFGAPASPDAPHSLVFTGSLFGAYDVNDVADLAQDDTRTPWLVRTGQYYGANGGLDYTFSNVGDRFNFAGHAGTRLSYYRRKDGGRLLPWTQADVIFGGRLTRGLSFSARQAISYTSHYNRSLAPRLGVGLGAGIDFPDDDALDVFELRAIRSMSTLGLSQGFGRNLALSGTYHFRLVDVLDDADDSLLGDRQTHIGMVGLLYSRPVSRFSTLSLGYAIRGTETAGGGAEPDVMHHINAGLNYGRALSFSRRTSFSFNTGSAVAVIDRVDTPVGDRQTRAYFTGNAMLAHEIGRTWTATLGYSRALRTWDEFNQLYLTDALTANLSGLVSRRLSLSANGSWAHSSMQNLDGTHSGYAASARAQYALSRFLAAYTQYVYYHYRFSDSPGLAGRYPGELRRQGVRLGLTTSVPLIR